VLKVCRDFGGPSAIQEARVTKSGHRGERRDIMPVFGGGKKKPRETPLAQAGKVGGAGRRVSASGYLSTREKEEGFGTASKGIVRKNSQSILNEGAESPFPEKDE